MDTFFGDIGKVEKRMNWESKLLVALIVVFLIGVGVIWITRLAMDLTFIGLNIPNIPLLGRAGLVGGLVAVLLIWLLKEKKIGFVPISI